MSNSSTVSPLSDRRFLRLFSAQCLSLLGTGFSSVALALLAYDLANVGAGALLGTALAIKMIAYIGIAPMVGAIAHQLPRRAWLTGLNLGRALLVLALPWVDSAWQMFVLMFLINALAAAYTPVFQAMLPDILPDEALYTKALSLSRIASDLESLLSPMLAAVLLTVAVYDRLFDLNSLLFLVAALCVGAGRLPVAPATERSGGFWKHLNFGILAYWRTPRLRALLALHLAVACAGAMVIVNTVVYTRHQLGLTEVATAQAMAAFGIGSMVAALLLPRLLNVANDREVMLWGAMLMTGALLFGACWQPGFIGLLGLWSFIGIGTATVLTPVGRVLRLSCQAGDRAALFSANFALSHAMWLVGYLAAGWLAHFGQLSGAFGGLAGLAAIATVLAWWRWPICESTDLSHRHRAIDHTHLHHHDDHHQHPHQGWEGPEPHMHDHHHQEQSHRHPFVIDEHHRQWPF